MRLLDPGPDRDPAVHLAVEEWCVRNVDPGDGILMVYVNDPCVVVGKNQNVYEEVDVAWARRRDVPVRRRLSGGGTVYHDAGNLNVCWFRSYRPGQSVDVPSFLEPLRRALEALGVPAVRNERNDLLVDGRKVSGNAQFTTVRSMLCHATLLYDADLDAVRASLRADATGIRSNATKSVRSPVTNLKERVPRVDGIEGFRARIVDLLAPPDGRGVPIALDAEARDAIERLAAEKYRSWEWTFGRAPRFTVERCLDPGAGGPTIVLEVEHGVVSSVRIPTGTDRRRLAHLAARLAGVRYERSAIEDALDRAGVDVVTDGIDATGLAARLHP